MKKYFSSLLFSSLLFSSCSTNPVNNGCIDNDTVIVHDTVPIYHLNLQEVVKHDTINTVVRDPIPLPYYIYHTDTVVKKDTVVMYVPIITNNQLVGTWQNDTATLTISNQDNFLEFFISLPNNYYMGRFNIKNNIANLDYYGTTWFITLDNNRLIIKEQGRFNFFENNNTVILIKK